MSDMLIDLVCEVVIDTAELVPFLFVTYLAMETLEHCASERSLATVVKAGRLGPVAGSILGAVPQCGFSAMAATLFSGGVVSVGTLLAVMLSTSDEMLPVFIAGGAAATTIAGVVMLKIVVGLIAGVTVDMAGVMLGGGKPDPHIHELCERAHCGCDDYDCDGSCEEGTSCAEDESWSEGIHGHSVHTHTHKHEHTTGQGSFYSIVRSALVHTIQVTAFILVITALLELVVEAMGTDVLVAIMNNHPYRSVFVASLIGLVPSCAVSVVIAQLYVEGSLAAGAMVAGLLSSAGAGLLVLFRTNSSFRQNLSVVVMLYVVAVICGLAVVASGIAC